MRLKPKVFIASATEDLALANAVFTELEGELDPTVWDQDLFAPSSYVIEGLEQMSANFEYAVFILSPSDERLSRSHTSRIPRDNIIAELGFSVGAIGRARTFVLVPRDEPLDLPTDFLGFITLKYTTRGDGNLRASVRTACTRIRQVVASQSVKSDAEAGLEAQWPLQIALIGQGADSPDRLYLELRKYSEVLTPVPCIDDQDARTKISNSKIDGAFIDFVALGAAQAVDLIAYVRDRHREIGIALYGTFDELFHLPGISGAWRETLQHYWKMPKDSNDESFAVTVEDMVLLLSIYRLSGGTFGEQPGSIARRMMVPGVAGSWTLWRDQTA